MIRALVLDHTGELGGAEIALVRCLAALDRGRVDARALLFAEGPLEDRLRATGVETDVVAMAGRTAGLGRGELVRRPDRVATAAWDTLAHARRLAARVRADGPDLLVANSLKSAVVGSVVARWCRLPLVWHLHDRLADDYLPPAVAAVMRGLARRIDGLVVNSRATAECVPGLDPGRVTLAYPGLDAEAFAELSSPGPGVERAGPARVGIVGRVAPTKGQREFVLAADRIVAVREDVGFVVAGRALFNDHGYEREVVELVEARGLADRVDMIGWVDDTASLMRSFDVVVHASGVAEPFGQVVLEAVAAGVPVVASAAGGVVEILDPDATAGPAIRGRRAVAPGGQLVAPGDVDELAAAIGWVLDHRDEAQALAAHARADALRRFSIEQTAAAVTGAWERAVARPRGRRRRPRRAQARRA